jgi:hypothetical protein
MFASGSKKRVHIFEPWHYTRVQAVVRAVGRPRLVSGCPKKLAKLKRRRELLAEKRSLSAAKAAVTSNPSSANIAALVQTAATSTHGQRAEPLLASLAAPALELQQLRKFRSNAKDMVSEMSVGTTNSTHCKSVVGALLKDCDNAFLGAFAAETKLSRHYLRKAKAAMAKCKLSETRLVNEIYAGGKRLGVSKINPGWASRLVGFFKDNSSVHSGQNSATLMLSLPYWVLHARLHASSPQLLREFAMEEKSFVIAAKKKFAAGTQKLTWLQANVLAALAQAQTDHFDGNVEYDLRFKEAEDRYAAILAKQAAKRAALACPAVGKKTLRAVATKLSERDDGGYEQQVDFSLAALDAANNDQQAEFGDIESLHPHHPKRFDALLHRVAGIVHACTSCQ